MQARPLNERVIDIVDGEGEGGGGGCGWDEAWQVNC